MSRRAGIDLAAGPAVRPLYARGLGALLGHRGLVDQADGPGVVGLLALPRVPLPGARSGGVTLGHPLL